MKTLKSRYKKKKKRGPVRAKKVVFDGIKFASGLERYMYQVLKKAKIKAMKDKAMVKVIQLIEVVKKYYLLNTHQTLFLIHL